jgi:hypothetical protein
MYKHVLMWWWMNKIGILFKYPPFSLVPKFSLYENNYQPFTLELIASRQAFRMKTFQSKIHNSFML